MTYSNVQQRHAASAVQGHRRRGTVECRTRGALPPPSGAVGGVRLCEDCRSDIIGTGHIHGDDGVRTGMLEAILVML